jgi:hypothetical protein
MGELAHTHFLMGVYGAEGGGSSQHIVIFQGIIFVK